MELKRTLGFAEVFCIASGAMISSGIFILPSLAFRYSGPAIVFSYLLAAVFIIPAMLSKAELATAMPKSGGSYYFTNTTLGPLFGTFAGFTNWLSLAMKSAFALLGIGIFLELLVPESAGMNTEIAVKILATLCTLFFMVTNILSVKESGRLQIILVVFLLAAMILYVLAGFFSVNPEHFVDFFASVENPDPKPLPTVYLMIWTAGLIFVSFGGLTNIASIAAEVKNPGKTIPSAMFTAFVVVSLLYAAIAFITVGILPPDTMASTQTPLSTAAEVFWGKPGFILMALAAMSAFITTANAGIMSASRNPMAMAEDNLIPEIFGKVSYKYKTPYISIILTSGFMIFTILILDLEGLVTVASAMMLLLAVFDNLSLILMRASRLTNYKPIFKAPLYPWIPIAGIIINSLMLIQLGWIPFLVTAAFFALSLIWYFAYSKSRKNRTFALIHVVERLTNKELKSENLENELKNILMERDQIIEDRFDRIIKTAAILNFTEKDGILTRNDIFKAIAHEAAKRLPLEEEEIISLLEEREKESSTVIGEGLAVPHFLFKGENQYEIIVIRSERGIVFDKDKPAVKAIFALAGSTDERNFHLQTLMAIAQIVKNTDFMKNWDALKSPNDIRNSILLADRIRKKGV